MNQIVRLVVVILAAVALTIAVLLVSLGLWASEEIRTIAGLRGLFGSFPLLALVLTLCTIPFAVAGAVGAYFLRHDKFGSAARAGAWLSSTVTIAITLSAELLTWRALFERTAGSSTAAIGFFILPVIAVVAAAVTLVMGMLVAVTVNRLSRR